MSHPAFTICIGPDSQLLRDRLDSLLAPDTDKRKSHVSGQPGPMTGAFSAPPSSWQRFVFWADEGLTASFWEHLTLQGLFASPKALILRNAQLLPADALKQLSPVLSAMAAGRGSSLAWPLLCFEVAFDKGKAKIPVHISRLPFWQTAEQKGWIEEIPGLTSQSVPAYIRTEAARNGIAASQQDLQRLAQALPPDAALISAELAKLALCVDARGKLPADAFALAEHSRELGIFELMRIVQQGGDIPTAWRQIQEDKLAGENMIFAFIAILLREARALWQILAGQPPYLPQQALMQKKMAAQALGFAGIARLWEISLMADKGIKTGERSTEQAFEMLAADLFALFSLRKTF